ncbi:hypothetical protein CVT08_03920 [Campylobacter concisus]|uniref:SGNH/GDSL hydrolase family protein n=2 Tax=Campylobacter concisus TaxID=199 RepID=A0A7S9RR82_9BACT|nr:hypothetical protein CVT08_03920 [Campylobacter concisus]
MVGLDIVLYFFLNNGVTSKVKFDDNKISKAEHFKLNSEKQKDIVFVGSSRTLHHISTNIFSKNNISIYNFGVSGNFIRDYPFISNVIKKTGTNEVVISIGPSHLFDDYSNNGFKIYTTDEFIANFGTDKMIFLKTLPDFFARVHLFLRYSEGIYNRIVGFYGKFAPDNKAKSSNFEAKNTFDVKAHSDCDLININEINSNATKNKKIIVAKCSNGDIILFSDALPRENYGKTIELKGLNQNTIKYFQNYVIDPLVKSGIKVVVILEPMFDGSTIKYDINEIMPAIKNAKVIDLTNFKFDDNELSDMGHHLNYLGRKRYSEFLVKLYLTGKL